MPTLRSWVQDAHPPDTATAFLTLIESPHVQRDACVVAEGAPGAM